MIYNKVYKYNAQLIGYQKDKMIHTIGETKV